jgi:WD40 repeat protein
LYGLASLSSQTKPPSETNFTQTKEVIQNPIETIENEPSGTLTSPAPSKTSVPTLTPTKNNTPTSIPTKATSTPKINYPLLEGTPLPSTVSVISADNARDIIELVRWKEDSTIGHFVFSPDSSILAYATEKNLIKIWDIKNKKLLHTLNQGAEFSICELIFSPSGTILASGDCNGDGVSDESVRLWETSSGELLHRIKGIYGYAGYIAFSPNGDLLAISVSNAKIHIRRVSDGKLIQILEAEEMSSINVAFSPDGKLLASVGFYCCPHYTVHLWDMDNNGRLLETFKVNSIKKIAFSLDSKFLVANHYVSYIKTSFRFYKLNHQ